MKRLRLSSYTIAISVAISTLAASAAHAQFPAVGAKDVRAWMTSGKKVLLVDTRTPDEYTAGHIPGAINIPADRMKAERAKLPKDHSTPIIFYCRGVG